MLMSTKVKPVRIAEVKLGCEGEILKALLGSCVGIAFVWKNKKRISLAHCLLPKSNRERRGIEAKYVDHAISSSLELLNVEPAEYHQLKAYIAGGANMMAQLSRPNDNHVGKNNLEAAIEILRELEIDYQVLETGRDAGIQIYVDCDKIEVYVEQFEKTG